MICMTLVLCCIIISVQGQLSITWNGITLTGPVAELIYQDELLVDTGTSLTVGDPDRIGALVCRSENTLDRVSWHLPNGFSLTGVMALVRVLQQIKETNALYISRLSRNGPINRSDLNGLWRCRRNADEAAAVSSAPGELVVGLYNRVSGDSDGLAIDTRGAVTITDVSISSSSHFMTDPPTFTLFGDTSFGPPTTNGWTRDGVPITNSDGSFSISTGVHGNNAATFEQTLYRSTLTVTGNLPGVYQYYVSNRATSPAVTMAITIEGEVAPTGLTAVQSGIGAVTVSWIPPSPPPSRGYRITVNSTDFTSDGTDVTSGTSHTLSLGPGTHAVRIVGLSQHLPSEVVGPVEVTVLGEVGDCYLKLNFVATLHNQIPYRWRKHNDGLITGILVVMGFTIIFTVIAIAALLVFLYVRRSIKKQSTQDGSNETAEYLPCNATLMTAQQKQKC